MTDPRIPGISQAEQEALYGKLNAYNEGRASYKEAGAYLVVLPRTDNPFYTLWVYSPLSIGQTQRSLTFFYICDLSEDVNEAMRMASTMCFYSPRRLFLVEYNAKRMQSRGDDIIPVGKYRGHFLHEILRIDPAYLSWMAYKFEPRIPKQERFVQIAKIYHSAYLDFYRRKVKQPAVSRFLGNEGEKVENLTLTVLSVRIEDNPYKTRVEGTTSYFYVRQVLKLRDAAGNFVNIRINARTASRSTCQLPAAEHAYQAGEILRISSARISKTYTVGTTKYTRLSHIKWA